MLWTYSQMFRNKGMKMRQGRGSRYDERVAALFDDESFCAQLRDSLPKERESVYCDTYLGKRSASDG